MSAAFYTSYETSLALRDAGAPSRASVLLSDPAAVQRAGEKILRRVSYRPGDCWIWTGAVNTDGYGVAEIGSIASGGRVSVAPHRVVYRWLTGPVPTGLELDHLCREPRCVNPQHLEPVTTRVNILRSTGPAAKNAAMPTCRKCGSEFTVGSAGKRYCRACHLRRSSDRQRRMWEAARAGTTDGERFRAMRSKSNKRARLALSRAAREAAK